MSPLAIVCLIIVTFFIGLLFAPFFGFILLDFDFHATLLFSGAGNVAPALFIGALYDGCRA